MGYLPASTSSARALTTVAPVPSNFHLAPLSCRGVRRRASLRCTRQPKRFKGSEKNPSALPRQRWRGSQTALRTKAHHGTACRAPRSRPPQHSIVSRCYGRVLCVHGVRGLPRRSLRGKRQFPVLSAVDNVSLTLLALCGLASHRCGGTTDADRLAP
jgi:hypothetical protein